jgi:hypothetical protein
LIDEGPAVKDCYDKLNFTPMVDSQREQHLGIVFSFSFFSFLK